VVIDFTLHELLADLSNQHHNRGGGPEVFVDKEMLDLLATSTVTFTLKPCEYGRGAWALVVDVRAAMDAAGMDRLGLPGLCASYRTKRALGRILHRLPQCEANGWEATAAKLMQVAEAKGFGERALALGVSLGILEIYRPARKRTDWYRLAGDAHELPAVDDRVSAVTAKPRRSVDPLAAFFRQDSR
jgi:hypothetical protein